MSMEKQNNIHYQDASPAKLPFFSELLADGLNVDVEAVGTEYGYEIYLNSNNNILRSAEVSRLPPPQTPFV